MRILLAALIGLIVSGSAYSKPLRAMIFGDIIWPEPNMLFFWLSCYLAFEGVLLVDRHRRERRRSIADNATTAFDLELRQTKAKLAELGRELGEQTEKNAALKTALDDAEARVKKSESSATNGPTASRTDPVATFLGFLQAEGKFVDFVMSDISQFDDAQIGAATRAVHQGCRTVVEQHNPIEPIAEQDEGASVTVSEGYDPQSTRLIGDVVGNPPFQGTVIHRGWRAKGGDVLSPTEVKVG